jgi:hypothetical protein
VPRNCGLKNGSSLEASSLVTIAAERRQPMRRAMAASRRSASRCRRCHHPSRQNTFASLRPTTTALSRAAGPFPRRRNAKRVVPRARARRCWDMQLRSRPD